MACDATAGAAAGDRGTGAVTVAEDGERLDLWLANQRGISRHQARLLIDTGSVSVNGRVARAARSVGAGDRVEVLEPPEPEARPLGRDVELVVVYEDDQIIVIDKPAGLVVHPAPGHPDGTLADGLRQRGATWSLVGGAARPGIVHRLDRDTSGLLVAAKTDSAHRRLAAQLQDRSMSRTYWALVEGVLPEQTGRIDAPIGRDPRDRKRMAVADTGRPSVTEFTVIERLARQTLLDVKLRTGRTHQIRVHLAHIGRPIVGDPLYPRRRGPASEPPATRPALHARSLRFLHPEDGRECSFDSEPPPDLIAQLERARRGEL